MRGAGRARAALDQRPPRRSASSARRTSNRNRASGSGARAMPCRARRVGTAQSNRSMPERDPLDQVVGLADPQQVARRVGVEVGRGHRDHASHLLLVAAQRPADREAVHGRRRDALGRGAAEVLVHAALDDPEHRLARAAPGARARRGSGPASGGCAPSSGRCSRDRRGTGCTRRRRARCRSRAPPAPPSTPPGRGTAPIRPGRSGSAPPPRRSRAPFPWPGWRPRRPLISSATLPWASEKTWKPPESVMIARSQPMNRCSPPSAAIRSGPGDSIR